MKLTATECELNRHTRLENPRNKGHCICLHIFCLLFLAKRWSRGRGRWPILVLNLINSHFQTLVEFIVISVYQKRAFMQQDVLRETTYMRLGLEQIRATVASIRHDLPSGFKHVSPYILNKRVTQHLLLILKQSGSLNIIQQPLCVCIFFASVRFMLRCGIFGHCLLCYR